MRPQLSIHWPTSSELWQLAPREDSLCAELADGHYSRQTPGADGFLAPGECLVLHHRGSIGRAVWGVVHNVFREVRRWRNAIFRNESGTLSSTLIVAATETTYSEWLRLYGTLPAPPPAHRSRRRSDGSATLATSRAGLVLLDGRLDEGPRHPGRARSVGEGRARGAEVGRMKRSNPSRSVPHATAFTSGVGIDGKRQRTDFAGASSRRSKRFEQPTMPPRPPQAFALVEDIGADLPEPVYGQYPEGLIAKLLPWLRCKRHEILHVCSGALPPGEGIRVDIRPEAKPDILADGRKLPLGNAPIAPGVGPLPTNVRFEMPSKERS